MVRSHSGLSPGVRVGRGCTAGRLKRWSRSEGIGSLKNKRGWLVKAERFEPI